MGRLDEFFQNLKQSLRRGIEVEKDDEVPDDESEYKFLARELNPEREQNMLDQIAARIKRMKIEAPAIMMLETFKPVNRVVSQLYGLYAAPFMEIFGIRGYDYAALFNKKRNVKYLINKINEKED